MDYALSRYRQRMLTKVAFVGIGFGLTLGFIMGLLAGAAL